MRLSLVAYALSLLAVACSPAPAETFRSAAGDITVETVAGGLVILGASLSFLTAACW